jgi:hypothetical protein
LELELEKLNLKAGRFKPTVRKVEAETADVDIRVEYTAIPRLRP